MQTYFEFIYWRSWLQETMGVFNRVSPSGSAQTTFIQKTGKLFHIAFIIPVVCQCRTNTFSYVSPNDQAILRSGMRQKYFPLLTIIGVVFLHFILYSTTSLQRYSCYVPWTAWLCGVPGNFHHFARYVCHESMRKCTTL